MPEFLLLMLGMFVAAVRSRRDLAFENLVLRHQLQVALRTNPHPRLRAPDRVLWVWLRRIWPDGWRQQLRLVQPETVLRWHRRGWRLYWTWKSRTRLGRPHLSAELRELIARISQENPLWGTERLRGELLKLGIVVSNRSIRRYRWRKPRPLGSQRWRTFLSNQLRGIWAADLFVIQTLTFRTLYVFFCIRHERRELLHYNVTASPTAAWIWHQLLEATPWGRQPKYLIHDRDDDGVGPGIARGRLVRTAPGASLELLDPGDRQPRDPLLLHDHHPSHLRRGGCAGSVRLWGAVLLHPVRAWHDRGWHRPASAVRGEEKGGRPRAGRQSSPRAGL